MPRYKAKCWFGTNIGMQEMEVNSASPNGAIDMLKQVYGAKEVYNIHVVGNGSNSSGSSAAGGIGILILVGAVMFAPWVLMTVGGAVGTWVSEKVVGSTLEESMDNDNMPKFSIIVLTALLCGGIGFYKGTEFQKYLNTPDVPAQQQNKK